MAAKGNKTLALEALAEFETQIDVSLDAETSEDDADIALAMTVKNGVRAIVHALLAVADASK